VRFFEVQEDDYGRRNEVMTLILKHPDSTTAVEIARRINESPAFLGVVGDAGIPDIRYAKAMHDGAVAVSIPQRWHGREMEFKEIVDTTAVSPDIVAQVSINQKTGVLAFTGNERVLPGAFTVRGVSVQIGGDGEIPDKPAPNTEVKDATVPVNKPSVELTQLIDTFNLLKLSAEEKISVMRALERNGLLQAKVIWE
jgi:flagellar basal body P-ring protein FlgI